MYTIHINYYHYYYIHVHMSQPYLCAVDYFYNKWIYSPPYRLAPLLLLATFAFITAMIQDWP